MNGRRWQRRVRGAGPVGRRVARAGSTAEAPAAASDSAASVPKPWAPRFGLRSLLLVMLVASVAAGAASYLLPAIAGSRQARLTLILFSLAAPVLLATLVSLLRAAFDRAQRPRPPRREAPDR